MTRALITGLSGFVGSHLADYLLAETDWSIYGLIRWRSPLDNIEHLLPRVNAGDRVHLLYGDLRDEGSIRAAVRTASPDYVFHLAAQSYPLTSFTAPIDTLDTNVQGTARLLEAIREHAPGAIVHVCSSSEVYGQVKRTPITEDFPFNPASPYAVSKVGTDLLAQFYARAYRMRIVVTRMFTHTGPRRGDVFAESSFAKQIAMAEAGMLSNPPVVYHGNLDSLRTVADVRDAVRAYYMAVREAPIAGEPLVFNIGGTHSAQVALILGCLLSKRNMQTAGDIRSRIDPSRIRPLDVTLQVPDCSKFIAHTGWKPEIHYEQTMLDLLNYWRERVKRGAQLVR